MRADSDIFDNGIRDPDIDEENTLRGPESEPPDKIRKHCRSRMA